MKHKYRKESNRVSNFNKTPFPKYFNIFLKITLSEKKSTKVLSWPKPIISNQSCNSKNEAKGL